MAKLHNLGYPRIGAQRELKKAVESYWSGAINLTQLEQVGAELRLTHWQEQADAGLDLLPVGDFAWYDQVLTLSATFGVIPERHQEQDKQITLDTLFKMARGSSPCCGKEAAACEMTKWFDTNYHYIVPEFQQDQTFKISYRQLLNEVAEAKAAGFNVKPVILGPISYLWLGKAQGDFNKLELLPALTQAYQDLLAELKQQGVEWIQLDEPALVLDLPKQWQQAYQQAYTQLAQSQLSILLATYFGSVTHNQQLALSLPISGIHLDLVRAPEQLASVLDQLPADWVLSAGVVNGRNIWKNDLHKSQDLIIPAAKKLGERLWLAPSCSLLHSPVDLTQEQQLDPEFKSWLAFAKQKLAELSQLKTLISQPESELAEQLLITNDKLVSSKQDSNRIHNQTVKNRVTSLTEKDDKRESAFTSRIEQQQQHLNLPAYPTTTIGSFPQTVEIRQTRSAFKKGQLSEQDYVQRMKDEITDVVKRQEALELDVLVHGEPERNDMVEYFGEQLEGFAFTEFGWVQSYGSRCVKPPIIFGDVYRSVPMTVDWTRYAQSLTSKSMKGMLTGPITILCWSFNRDDISREQSALQIALAIRDEVVDLEQAGIKVIQIDEPALREGLPLRQADKAAYLDWATKAFRISASGVKDQTQIHTHMCYCEFNDIIDSIAALDADVITIETSRSNMELLEAFNDFKYPNDIGPGVYDIHSPNVPTTEWMVNLIQRAAEKVDPKRLWVNPDCGLKTRGWPETEAALRNMVEAAKQLRAVAL